MTLILAQQNRGLTRDIVILDSAGEAITPAANDRVRVSIGRDGETPKLTVESGTPTAAGSTVVTGAANRMRLDASDLAFEPGTYTLTVDLFDHSDAEEWKTVDRQVFQLEPT